MASIPFVFLGKYEAYSVIANGAGVLMRIKSGGANPKSRDQ
jgi:hypothetical protein